MKIKNLRFGPLGDGARALARFNFHCGWSQKSYSLPTLCDVKRRERRAPGARTPHFIRVFNLLLVFTASEIFLCGCTTARVGKMERRTGDEIVAAGQFFHTGTPVVLWLDPGGYDAYRVERRSEEHTSELQSR